MTVVAEMFQFTADRCGYKGKQLLQIVFRRVERQYGSFTRSFTLPNTVDTDNIQAGYSKGILKIQLAKKAEAKPKQIKVNVSGERQLEGKEAKGAGKAA